MALKRTREILDTISYEELGIQFDEGMVWEKLESRLAPPARRVYPIQWMVAATFFLAVFFIPMTFLKENKSMNNVEEVANLSKTLPLKEENDLTSSSEIRALESNGSGDVSSEPSWIPTIASKKLEPVLATITIPDFEQINIAHNKSERIKPEFAVEDISVIQASLEDAPVNDLRIEKGRRIFISAQWQASPKDAAKSLERDSQEVSFEIDLRQRKKSND